LDVKIEINALPKKFNVQYRLKNDLTIRFVSFDVNVEDHSCYFSASLSVSKRSRSVPSTRSAGPEAE
jgi:hypothetical protein